MTIITKLSATGFKSFARKTDLIFGNNFNCVIGPNGSGKSNIMDALCFVLGKSSAKSLRAEKSANLIYNGGKKGQPSKKAEVHIFFDNSKNEFPFNTPEIKVSRVLNQKGMSKYLVNDKVHTRQQVVDLLNKVGINPDGHNIILQGDIVHFMQMKPNDRRDLISDISGISMFDDKKNKSLRELEKVEGKLTEANVLLVEREANLRELKKDRDQAKKYVDLKNKFKDSKATYLHLLLREKKERRDSIQKVQDEHNGKINVIQSKIKEIRTSITEKQTEIQEINYQLDQKGEGELKLLQMEIGSLKSGVYKHEARVETVKSELLKIKNRKKQLLGDISENEKKIISLDREKISLNKKINLIKEEDSHIDNKLIGFKKKYGIENLGDINVKLSELDKKIEEKEKLLNGAGDAKQDLVRELDRVSFRLDGIRKELDRLNKSKNSNSLKELRKKHGAIEKELSKVIGEDSILSGKVGDGWSKINSLESELSKFKAKEVGIKEGILNNKSIDKVRKFKGVFGTVSELGNVEEKYSLALEVAAGARIKSVVTKDDIIAGHCIKELKNNRLGVATFLPLNKIKARRKESVSALLKKNEVYGLAIDLVNFDKKYANVFDYVFGNTLVVENIETARKIGIGKMRMVTIGGDLVESSGAMIGGFRGRTGIGFNQKQISEKVSVLGEELSNLNRDLQEGMERRSEIEHEIESLRNKKAELYGDIVKIEKSLGIGSSEDIIKENKELDRKKLEFEKELEIIDKDFSKFEFDVNELKKEKSEINEKLINNPEIRDNLTVLESEKEKLRDKIVNINSDLSILNNQLNMYHSEVGKVKEIISGHNKEEEEFGRELVDLNKVVSGKKTDLKDKEVKEREFYGKNKELASKRNKMMELLTVKEEGIGKEEDKINLIRNKVNEVSIKLAKAIGEIEGLEVEFEEYKDGKIRKGVSIESLKKDISDFERMINNIGNINMRALEIYDELSNQYDALLGKTNKLKVEKDDVLVLIGEIEEKKADVFMKTFNHLHSKFREIFNNISTKGQASLVLENEENPLDGGVDINVKISGSKKLDIRSLSGGEKTMAALAFIFAIQEYNPASFYLLDEVDAALDKHNSEKLSKLINTYSGTAQYIVISHNDSIITEANQIYGISMNEGVSKITSLRL
ncbi:chromosome segregation protein SMC [Candidatus Woesearchaeota archaeon]|nr:chromosome segregation protein SMC [Candidatus Woesearchaeota archaeon]MBT4321884.1 chromosome segregation protein SMC [Candidatus Woesearchaeota archaeon]